MKEKKEDMRFWYGLIAVIFMLVVFLAWAWMDTADRLTQKYICPCFNYYINETTGYYEAVRVASCQCLSIDIEDAKVCSPISDTICRNVSADRLVCDGLSWETI
ncbi:MAG: hypothetical protein MUP55_02850 [Candidatus Aenigmarchaeota archaeon]|nr:hypothetical protein [Candidatus Aenigmarchaeota archaeon]